MDSLTGCAHQMEEGQSSRGREEDQRDRDSKTGEQVMRSSEILEANDSTLFTCNGDNIILYSECVALCLPLETEAVQPFNSPFKDFLRWSCPPTKK